MINYLDENNPNCPTKIDLQVAKEVAEYLNIPFYIFDYRETYSEKVLDYMYE
jgi:tRNA U34 2-thiouridine synthase MnmA/TrmU